MNKKAYQICTRTIMDTSDPEITFNENGESNYCEDFDKLKNKIWFPNQEGGRKIEEIVSKIKNDGKGKEYDCIIGLSGGIDSSFLAYKASKLGLRILAVHVDGGWNSELAVQNIEQIVKVCKIDLHTHVVDWQEMRDLQIAYLKSAIANQDVPQDHAFFAALYGFAIKNNINWVLHGSNIATEFILPTSWGYHAMDSKSLLSIHKQFGSIKLKSFPIVNFFDYHFYFPFIKKMKVARLLNYMYYDRELAINTLIKEVGFKDYGGKHSESRFTKFFQGYYLPVKFGIDKRRAHLSSMILSGIISREEALVEINKSPYNPDTISEDFDYISKKLEITSNDLKKLLELPNKSYKDYPNNEWLVKVKSRIRKSLKK
ncbi:MAG: N-acetyl sugar amidotransferase [Cytophagaceae bacterium]|nr:N-acetyl sugar amidotransferase [Cytophagaceae bacterium]